MRRSKLISAEEAAGLVKDHAHVVIMGSGGGVGEPTHLLRMIRQRFDQHQAPRGLTLYHATGLGDKKTIGTDLLALDGLVKRDIAGHLGMAPQMAAMIADNRIESYNFPQGVISQMFRAIAARQPGVFTKVGMGTYIDPRLEGGRMNERTRQCEQLVRVEQIDGESWLFFPRWHIDVALIRGTTADLHGNITSEQEAAVLEGVAMAQAARACRGIVIAQVKYLAEVGSLDPRRVTIPGTCVDYIVVDEHQKQTCLHEYNPALSGQSRVPLEQMEPLPLDARKVIARRAARELFPGAVINVGVGMPDGVAAVAAEQGMLDQVTFTVEQGVIGGQPAKGVIFGVSYNPEAMIQQPDQFNFYDGGNLDLAFLGMAEVDAEGNVNASKVGSLLTGCGGFINITQNARRVVFCGTLTAKNFTCAVGGGRLQITREGSVRKFVPHVEQITFSGQFARKSKQSVVYVTERAVFELNGDGVVLRELAPGVDLKRDVLDQMAFAPIVPSDIMTMDPQLFE